VQALATKRHVREHSTHLDPVLGFYRAYGAIARPWNAPLPAFVAGEREAVVD